MKKYKNNIILFVLFVFFANPFSGWAQDPFKEEFEFLLEEIQDRIEKKTPLIVAIGGCPGVGKSTLAKLLQAELSSLSIASTIISIDHYGLSQEERKQFSSELDPRRIQWNKLHSTLSSICEGEKEIIKPTINQLTKEMGQETLHLANVDCILFEGSYVLGDFSPMNFLQYTDLTIYLESSLENIYDWKWQRELKKASPRSSESFFHHMMEILRDFAFHVYPTRKNAEFIIRIDRFHRYLVAEVIKSNLEPDFTSLRLEMLNY